MVGVDSVKLDLLLKDGLKSSITYEYYSMVFNDRNHVRVIECIFIQEHIFYNVSSFVS